MCMLYKTELDTCKFRISYHVTLLTIVIFDFVKKGLLEQWCIRPDFDPNLPPNPRLKSLWAWFNSRWEKVVSLFTKSKNAAKTTHKAMTQQTTVLRIRTRVWLIEPLGVNLAIGFGQLPFGFGSDSSVASLVWSCKLSTANRSTALLLWIPTFPLYSCARHLAGYNLPSFCLMGTSASLRRPTT